MTYQELVGRRAVELADYDGEGNDLYCMWLTDEEIIRCYGCKKADKQEWKCNRFAVGYWDAEQEADVIIRPDIKPDGFCSWAERDA